MNEVVLSSIDEGLDSIGSTAKRVLYFYLEQRENIKRGDIVTDPEKFRLLLRGIFGPGSAIIERNILFQLQKKTKRRDLPDSFSRAVAEITNPSDVDAPRMNLRDSRS